jgi:magnesium chelatase accessory protein
MVASCCVRKPPHSENFHGWELEKLTWPHHDMSRFVEAAGIHWHVQQMGVGPQLLLVHGTGASTHSWRELMPVLATRFSVTAVDLPGHGFTDALSPARSSIAGISESLAALLSALKVSPHYCVGHSAGAVVICKMAMDRLIAPRALVSINGAFIPYRGAASRLLSPIARLLAGRALVSRLIARRARTHARVVRLIASTGSRLDQAGVELYARLARNPRHVAGALRMMSSWNLDGFELELRRLKVPLSLIVAENDLMVPPSQALIVQQMVASSTLHRLSGLGHLAHEEEPEQIAQRLFTIFAAHS